MEILHSSHTHTHTLAHWLCTLARFDRANLLICFHVFEYFPFFSFMLLFDNNFVGLLNTRQTTHAHTLPHTHTHWGLVNKFIFILFIYKFMRCRFLLLRLLSPSVSHSSRCFARFLAFSLLVCFELILFNLLLLWYLLFHLLIRRKPQHSSPHLFVCLAKQFG